MKYKINEINIIFTIFITLFINISYIKADGCNYSFYHEIEEGRLDTTSAVVGSVYIKGVIKEIKQNDDGTWSGESSYDLGGKEDLINWDEDSCPDFIGITSKFTGKYWYGFNHDDVLEKGADLVNLVEDCDRMWVYKNDEFVPEAEKDNYVCDYATFKITFNGEGYALKAESTIEAYGSAFFYKLSNAMSNDPVVEPGECENVYYCLTAGGYSSYPEYTIFADELDYDKNKDLCQETLLLGEIFSSSSGDYESGCRTYGNYIKKMQSEYMNCQNNKNCLEYYKLKNEITSLCKSLTSYASFKDSQCLRSCLNLKNDINNKVEININQPSRNCGISEKILIWIGNIVRWGKYLIPVIVIVLGILDFIKAIAADKDDEMKKAQGRFVKRLIAAALIFIIPFIIEFVLGKLGFDSNGCGIIDL